MKRFLVGIDEAGRGPLAGPVAVGVVVAPIDTPPEVFAGIRDSKKLSEKAREAWFERLPALEAEYGVRYKVEFSSAHYIDEWGIVPAIKRAIAAALTALAAEPSETRVVLDGSLKAPNIFEDQETIIRGDESEPIISLASVAAKVTRDRLMHRLAERYPEYGFEIHKGYGTALHREALIKHGLCDIHRKTFIKL